MCKTDYVRTPKCGTNKSTTGHPKPELAREPETISLLDIYKAVEGDKPLLHLDTHTNPECGIGVNIQLALQSFYDKVQKDAENSMAGISLSDIIRDIISGLKIRTDGVLIMEIKRDHILTGSFCALGCEILYGLSYIFTKQVTAEVSALSLLGWRFLLAFIVMSILAGTGFIKIRLKGRSVKPLLWIALFSPGIYFIGETFGISHTTASESGAFLACIPVASDMHKGCS